MPSSTPTDRHAWPYGMVGMLVLVVAVELVVSRYELDFTNFVRLSWKQSGRAARSEAAGCEVLALGDSLMKFGMVPRAIQRTTGRPAYNLAAFAASPPVSTILLERALAAGARPSAVMLECEQHLLTSPSVAGFQGLWEELLSPRECAELAWSGGDFDFFARKVFHQLLPSMRDRAALRAAALDWVRETPPPDPKLTTRRVHMEAVRRNWSQNRGEQDMPRGGPMDASAIDGACAEYFPTTWNYDPVSVAYLERLLRLTRDRGIRVFWLLPPLSPPAQARREQTGMDASYTRFLENLQAKFPHLVVLDGRRSGYEAVAFFDALHLCGKAAASFSLDVAATIEPYLADAQPRPRWVALPAFRDRPSTVPMEELEASRVAVESEKARRR